jgi:hypothetical protein
MPQPSQLIDEMPVLPPVRLSVWIAVFVHQRFFDAEVLLDVAVEKAEELEQLFRPTLPVTSFEQCAELLEEAPVLGVYFRMADRQIVAPFKGHF